MERVKTVDSGGVSLGAPVFVSTSCWSGGVAAIAPPVITSTTNTQSRTVACSAGMPALESGQQWQGNMTERRTVTVVSTQFEWDAVPTTQSASTNWVVVSQANCTQMCREGGGQSGSGGTLTPCPDHHGQQGEGPGMGHGGSGNAGAGPDGVGGNA